MKIEVEFQNYKLTDRKVDQSQIGTELQHVSEQSRTDSEM